MAQAFRGRIWQVLGLALVLVSVGVVLPGVELSLIFITCGATLTALLVLLRLMSARQAVAEKALAETVAGFTELDSSPCFTTDLDGAVTHFNASARKRFSVNAGESLPRVMRDLLANPAALLRRLETRADTRGHAAEDVVTRKGHMRLVVHRLGEDGFLWRMEDMVEREGSRGAESLSLPMMTINKTGAVLFMNESLRRVIGGRAKRLEDIIVDVSEAGISGPQRITASVGELRCHVVEIAGQAGRREVYLLPSTDVPGRPVQDGTASLELLDHMPVALLRIQRDGTLTMANRLARELLGHDALVGMSFADLVEGLGRSVRDWVAEAAEGRGPLRPEVARAKLPVQDVFLQISLSRVVEDGEASLVAVLNDATELKTLEAQFVQSQKMQAIGQLAGGVAHDFNNLLTAIAGHCDLLLLRHDQGDPDYGDLVQINQNANRAASLVGQLLAFSRKQNLQPEVLDMRETLSDLGHLLNRLVGERVNLALSHEPDLPSIRADKRQLEQVIMNLVVNARDAMPEGGTITVETQQRVLKEEMHRDRATVPPGGYVVVCVSDEGSGIHPDKIGKVFEPFWTTKRPGEGTGLGLSTAYGIVKQTGGYIFVDSVLGQGSCFTLYLPVHDRPEEAPRPTADAVPRDHSAEGEGVILLVEDEAPVRAFASRALRMRGYTVLEAENAEDALKMLEDIELKVDVFVTDVIMPGMDGPSWVRKALEMRPDVKVVFVSGYAEDSFDNEQALIPNSVFLPKPFSLNELTAKVHDQTH
ncbi:ATP-binding protein [Oceanicola sp. 502str15]|uniref:hybrid sensor histidine kinase/response regulator n=1 Tax=Oceanicola sp. 502str15 TaxID=2696061 RepID=UPI002095C250|nr:ATP-binding protein [Oceanicola sp. 502str15]MCO6382311.1 response regulator [Oceanicola sp. 502str15]